jgi:hypothetical protein
MSINPQYFLPRQHWLHLDWLSDPCHSRSQFGLGVRGEAVMSLSEAKGRARDTKRTKRVAAALSAPFVAAIPAGVAIADAAPAHADTFLYSGEAEAFTGTQTSTYINGCTHLPSCYDDIHWGARAWVDYKKFCTNSCGKNDWTYYVFTEIGWAMSIDTSGYGPLMDMTAYDDGYGYTWVDTWGTQFSCASGDPVNLCRHVVNDSHHYKHPWVTVDLAIWPRAGWSWWSGTWPQGTLTPWPFDYQP